MTYWDKAALAAAGIIEAVAMAGVQISTIQSQKFARGTTSSPGGMALVGEEGPEMVNLPRGSQVQTAAQTRQFIGGTNISPTLIIHGNADDSTVNKIENVLVDFARNFEDSIRSGHTDLSRIGIATV